ncbi:hypothetical protein M514_06551 [Trichuris suis]|uniref:Uncharacterized protein n=1 Tax=Trichuris suis TaxID=68888 RepID=A0A085M5M1_9BILA|nr:hypothetical protein M513_06551 [Trichuris suis]KFD65224.1 hypothetical protein M514_06551 [Trichuris suis]
MPKKCFVSPPNRRICRSALRDTVSRFLQMKRDILPLRQWKVVHPLSKMDDADKKDNETPVAIREWRNTHVCSSRHGYLEVAMESLHRPMTSLAKSNQPLVHHLGVQRKKAKMNKIAHGYVVSFSLQPNQQQVETATPLSLFAKSLNAESDASPL